MAPPVWETKCVWKREIIWKKTINLKVTIWTKWRRAIEREIIQKRNFYLDF
jgi:hypothetical protein